jgi:hypothetical protein
MSSSTTASDTPYHLDPEMGQRPPVAATATATRSRTTTTTTAADRSIVSPSPTNQQQLNQHQGSAAVVSYRLMESSISSPVTQYQSQKLVGGALGGCCCGFSLACLLCIAIPATLLLLGYLFLVRPLMANSQQQWQNIVNGDYNNGNNWQDYLQDNMTLSSYVEQFADAADDESTISSYFNQWWGGSSSNSNGGGR